MYRMPWYFELLEMLLDALFAFLRPDPFPPEKQLSVDELYDQFAASFFKDFRP